MHATVTAHCLDDLVEPRSPNRSASTNEPSTVDKNQTNRTLSPRKSQDPALRVLDITTPPHPPFISTILHQDAPLHFMLPKFQMYDGLEDPFDYLMHFCQIMTLQSGNDALLCKVFSSSLIGSALSWFHHLSPNTITSFHVLSENFRT